MFSTLRSVTWIGTLSLVVALTGCGTGNFEVPAAPPLASALNGNWLITGTLPFADTLHPAGNTSFGLAMTFSVVGNQVVASEATNLPCGTSVRGGADGGVVMGTVATDGTFTLASITNLTSPISTVLVRGTAPRSGGSSWSGTYQYTNTTANCAAIYSGPVMATRIGDLSSTYAGATPLMVTPAGSILTSILPASVSISFQQGQTLPGTTQLDAGLLAGTIKIQGIPCFVNGTASATASSVVQGISFSTIFTMDDGTKLNVFGLIEDSASTKLLVASFSGRGVNCSFVGGKSFEAIKQ
jgi:hypothetical protein